MKNIVLPDRLVGNRNRVCLLLKSGWLIGMFSSRDEAIRWANLNSLRAYSTYDLIAPETMEHELEHQDIES